MAFDKDSAQSVLAAILAAHPDATVEVVNSNGGATVAGFRSSLRGAGELDLAGNVAQPSETVWVDADDIGTVLLGWGLTVAGVRVNVIAPPQRDPAGALLRIDYTVNDEK
jgi:hypothetical protein